MQAKTIKTPLSQKVIGSTRVQPKPKEEPRKEPLAKKEEVQDSPKETVKEPPREALLSPKRSAKPLEKLSKQDN